MKLLGYIARDQHGNYYHSLNHPRKDLLARFGRKHAEKMYVDTVGGGHRHVGYVIAGHWLRVYAVCEWKEAIQ